MTIPPGSVPATDQPPETRTGAALSGQRDNRTATQPVMEAASTTTGCQDSCCGEGQQASSNPAALAADPNPSSSTCCSDKQPAMVVQDKSGPSFEDACCAADQPLSEDVPAEDSCEDGCCSDKQPAKVLQGKSVSDCKDACCAADQSLGKDVPAEDSCGDSCCADNQPAKALQDKSGPSCQDGCCAADQSPKEDIPVEDNCKDGCCSDNQPAKALQDKSGPGCQDACCAQEQADVKASQDPECCDGKPSPCCDSSCLDRLVARECRPSTSTQSGHPPTSTQEVGGQPDGVRALTTREKYAAKLQALGCLCRALLAVGQESCCAPPERSSLERKRRSKASSVASRKSVDSCCASGNQLRGSGASMKARSQGMTVRARSRSPKESCSDGCCSPADITTVCKSPIKDRCSKAGVTSIATHTKVSDEQARDLETGISGKEHVILSVSGMTCTGCETKLQRTLASLTSVKNLRTSLVLSRAEFDLDLSIGTAAQVMKHLERTTEFKCQKISNKGSSVDVVTIGGGQKLIDQAWPLGVLEMTLVEKDVVNIAFDPKIIGARDLIKKGWDSPLQLAPPRPDPALDMGSKHVRRVGLTTILSAILTIPVLVMAWAPIPEREIAYGSASLALATLVQVLIAGPFYSTALKSLLFSRVIEMDLLVVLSTTTAYVYSIVSFGYLVAGKPLSTGQFFETSTLLVTLIMVGRYVAALARQKAVESISIRSLQAPTAILVEEGGDTEIDIRLLQHGDIFKVLPNSNIATDGTVISGSSEVDESMVTGESKPIEKYTKSAVIAGSINGAGTMLIRLNRLPGDNTISAIANLVDEAKLSKTKSQELADRVASYFVPVVVGLTLITFCIWIAVGVAVQAKSGSESVIQAISFAITVLIVSCPCAVGLAVPMVIVIASGIAAERGVIIKSASTIEVAHKVTHVVLDKTGTLTQGQLFVKRESYSESKWTIEQTQALLLALLATNKHPVSAALTAKLVAGGVEPAPGVQDIQVLTGRGIEAVTSSGLVLRAGNSRWLGISSSADVQSISSEGNTTFCFTINGSLAVVFGLQDTLRPDAASTVTELHRRGIAVHVLSGDDDNAVRTVTSQLNIPEDHVRSRCTPADKQTYIKELQSRSKGSSQPTIIFCGDGTNDAVALAQATIGVHLNDVSGTDVAKFAADVNLMQPKLAGILTLIDVSKKSVRRIFFNFGWSAVYNLFAILLAGGAFAALPSGRVEIPPAFAGLGELVSVLPVVAAAVLMRWERV